MLNFGSEGVIVMLWIDLLLKFKDGLICVVMIDVVGGVKIFLFNLLQVCGVLVDGMQVVLGGQVVLNDMVCVLCGLMIDVVYWMKSEILIEDYGEGDDLWFVIECGIDDLIVEIVLVIGYFKVCIESLFM